MEGSAEERVWFPARHGYWTLAAAWARDLSLSLAGAMGWLLPWIRRPRSTSWVAEWGRAVVVSLPPTVGLLYLLSALTHEVAQEVEGVFYRGGPPWPWRLAMAAAVSLAFVSASASLRLSRPYSELRGRRADCPDNYLGAVLGIVGAVVGFAAAGCVATVGFMTWCRRTGLASDPAWLTALDDLSYVPAEFSFLGAALVVTALLVVGIFACSGIRPLDFAQRWS